MTVVRQQNFSAKRLRPTRRSGRRSKAARLNLVVVRKIDYDSVILKKLMANFSTEQFLQEYFDALTADSNVEYEFWQSIMESIRSRNSIQQSMYETLEQLVNQRLDILRKDQLVAIYKETENWLSADEPSEDDLSIELIKIELVEEMMDQITSLAWDQARKKP